MRKKLFSILALLLTVCGAWAQSNTEDTYIVAGSEPEIFGTSWDGSNQANQMVKGDDGKYSKVYTVDKAYKNVQLKVVKNGEDWFGVNGNNYEFKLTGAGSFTVSFDPVTNGVSVTGEFVEEITGFGDYTVYAVGNGEDNWLNGAAWDPAYAANEMTEVADNVWQITFNDVPDGFERQVKFAIDGAWTHNFGWPQNPEGDYELGEWFAAGYNGDNITFDTDDDCTVTLTLDLTDFNFNTKEGAKFKINIEYPTDQTDMFYLVGSFNEWQIDQNYKLVLNAEAEGEYYINGVELSADDEFKVQSAAGEWFPNGMDNNYVISADGTYDIYFRPNYDGGGDWYYNCIYAADVTPIDYGETVEVTLAPTGYGTYYNSGKMVTLPTGVVAYAVSDVTGDLPTYELIADGNDVSNRTVPAATAVLLYCDTKPEKITLTLTEPQNSYSGTNLLMGSDSETTTTGGGDGAKYYKLTYGSVSGHESIFGWYWGADNGGVFTSPAHKAWLALPASNSNNARAFFNLPSDDATGIPTIENKQQNADNVWYDLNGCRINAPKTKGIYVKDGRKLVIK